MNKILTRYIDEPPSNLALRIDFHARSLISAAWALDSGDTLDATITDDLTE